MINCDISRYSGMRIVVAVSGGRDSMALLHFLRARAREYGLTLFAVNCDHGIRGETSERDSAFVKRKCEEWNVPLFAYKENCTALANLRKVSVETAARDWRQFCYFKACKAAGGAVVATAHHLDDNAETVLFNLARGSGLAGVAGICDGVLRIRAAVNDGGICAVWEGGQSFCTVTVDVIRPFIECPRAEIDGYVAENGVEFVEDETNLTDGYTRNKLRHNVLPELENAVSGAAKSITRFSHLARRIEEYIARQAAENTRMSFNAGTALIATCSEYVLFSYDAVFAVCEWLRKKDYTLSHINSLYNLQFTENGKKFEFLGLVAYKEDGRIAICAKTQKNPEEAPFEYKRGFFGGKFLNITKDETTLPMKRVNGKYVRLDASDSYFATAEGDKFERKFPLLKFDCSSIPDGAVIRTRRAGDKFCKFGGGTKSLGDYFTDKKIPVRLRDEIPLIAVGSEVLAICGVEISDKVKVTDETDETGFIVCDIVI